MSDHHHTDWNPGTYGRFRGLRMRPALDLIAQVPTLPEGAVVDLGCGAGAAAEALAAVFPGRALVGVDNSPAMLAETETTGLYESLIAADISGWAPEAAPALIFSNAVLHWLPDHETLLPRLAGLLAPGGTLAVQMPRQYARPSHSLLREIAAEMFPDRFDFAAWLPPVGRPEDHVRLLMGQGAVNAWETSYIQQLAPVRSVHPVLRFTEATAMRPFLEQLEPEEAARFTSAYEAALAQAYPVEEDGRVLFPFLRTFFTVTVPAVPD